MTKQQFIFYVREWSKLSDKLMMETRWYPMLVSLLLVIGLMKLGQFLF